MEQLLEYDKDLFLFLNSLGTETWDGFWLFMSHKLYQIPLYAVLLYLIFRTFGVKGTIITLVIVAALIAASDQTSNLFKNILFQRPRPCRIEGIEEFTRMIAKRCVGFGYFSAHAANSMGLAFFVGLILKKQYKYLLLFMVIWAVLVGYSRIYVGVHFPGDVITGMVIGILFGFIAFKLHIFLFKNLANNN